jgi:hypothetical protein
MEQPFSSITFSSLPLGQLERGGHSGSSQKANASVCRLASIASIASANNAALDDKNQPSSHPNTCKFARRCIFCFPRVPDPLIRMLLVAPAHNEPRAVLQRISIGTARIAANFIKAVIIVATFFVL